MNTMIRKKYTNEEWMQIFHKRKQSGLSIRKWCEQTDISYDMYKYWEKKLCKINIPIPKDTLTPNQFVELPLSQVHQEHKEIVRQIQPDWDFKITYKDFQIDIGTNANLNKFAEIIETLQRYV